MKIVQVPQPDIVLDGIDMVYSPRAYFTWLKLFYRPQMLWAPKILPRYKLVGYVWAIFMVIGLLSSLTEWYKNTSPDDGSRLVLMVAAALVALGFVSFLVFWPWMITLGTRLCSNGSQTVVPGPTAPLFIGKFSYSARKALLILVSVYATCKLILAVYSALLMRHDDPLSFMIIPLAVSLCQFILVIFGTRFVADVASMVFCQRLTAHEMAEAEMEYQGFDYVQETNPSNKSVLALSLALFGVLAFGVVFAAGISMGFLVAVPAYCMILRLLCGKSLSFGPSVFMGYFFLTIGILALFHFWSFTQYFVPGGFDLNKCIPALLLIAGFVLDFILGLLVCETASAICGRPSKS